MSVFKQYLENAKFSDRDEIGKIRKLMLNKKSIGSELTLTSGLLRNENPHSMPLAWSGWFSDFKPEVTLLSTEPKSILGLTNFYYKEVDTVFGPKPFETFLLNCEFCRITGCPPTRRTEVFVDYSKNEPYMQDLLIDTMNFVMTGKRQINVHVLLEMAMTHHSTVISGKWDRTIPNMNVKPLYKPEEAAKLSSQDFFTKWISRKGGKEDFITAHRIMLGT